jgi:hypothetical protein
MTRVPTAQHGAVLADVKAKPFGWPAASPDPGSGRHKTAAIGTTSRQEQNPKKESLRFEGIAAAPQKYPSEVRDRAIHAGARPGVSSDDRRRLVELAYARNQRLNASQD